MCLYTKINLMKFYIYFLVILSSACYSYAQEEENKSPVKAMIIREIMRKVSNITLNSLANVPDDKKALVLNKIERKLSSTAAGLADGQKYVNIIMEEFRKKAYHNSHKESFQHNFNNNDEIQRKNNMLRAGSGIYEMPPVQKAHKEKPTMKRKINVEKTTTVSTTVESHWVGAKVFDNQTKQRLISDIAHKIEKVAKGYLRSSQTMEDKEKILQKIKNKIVESSRRKHMQIHHQHSELKAYADLITQGFELSMMRILNKNARRMEALAHDTSTDHTMLILPDILNDTDEIEPSMIDQIGRYKLFLSEIWKEANIDPKCDEIIDELCLRLGSLHKLSCGDGQVISVMQLCDGISDCWNDSDETNCTDQAILKIRQAISIMTEIDATIPGKCLQPIAERDMLSYHNQLLRNKLEEQLKHLEKYTPPNTELTPVDKDFDINFVKTSIPDIRNAINTLSYAFETNVCTPHGELFKKCNHTRRVNNEPIDLENDNEQSKWLPKTCICKHQSCKVDNCDPRCKQICYQKHSLNHWQCQAIVGDTTISLDLICDGKLDCYDESDEASCTSAASVTKYEANNLYKNLLDLLSLKSLSLEYGNSRNKIGSQINIVRQLQQLTTKNDVDVHAIKMLRDEYFKLLVQIYKDLMQTSSYEELDKAYEFLLILSEKMITALKLSHSGNVNNLSPAGCYCHNGTCAIVRCSEKCVATCHIEPLLTKFSCNDNSTYVNIKAVCNGKKDCPNEEDEKDCGTDVCRYHHLYVLRHNLENAGPTHKGTTLWETLEKWKSKVISSMIIIQGNERPNHRTIEDLVTKVLRDLVTSFAGIEDNRRMNRDVVIREFRNMSDIVKQTLKSCTN